MGKSHSAPAVHQIPSVDLPHLFEVVVELFRQSFRQQRASVLAALAVVHGEFAPIEIQVMNPQAQGLHQS